MQKPKVEEPIAITHNTELSPLPQRFDSTETFEKTWNEKKKGRRNQSWWSNSSENGLQANWVTLRLQLNKKDNHSTLVATFDRNLKRLVSVGDSYFGKPFLDHWLLLWRLKYEDGGWEHRDISRDCVPCTYHPILFWKDQEGILGFDHPKTKSILWPRQMHQASRFDQPILELTRLMALPSNYFIWSRQEDQAKPVYFW